MYLGFLWASLKTYDIVLNLNFNLWVVIVILMCAIQELCISAKTRFDLYLQTSYPCKSFIWFIMLEFCYSSLHFGPNVDINEEKATGFPLCSDPSEELPENLASLAVKGEVVYASSVEDEKEGVMIRQLYFKKQLYEWFPPMSTTDHSLLTQWLYSVPFPPPLKYMSWLLKSGGPTLIQHLKSLIPKDCIEMDTDWSSAKSDSGINDLKKFYFFNMAMREKEYEKYCGVLQSWLLAKNGNGKLLQYSFLLWM